MTKQERDRKFQLWGWVLFVVSSGFYLAISIRDWDTLTFLGALFFLLACIVFIIPLVGARDDG